MKKKKILFITALLLIIAVPFSIVFGNFDKISFTNILKKSSASVVTNTDDYVYSNWGVSAGYVFKSSTIPGFCVNSDSCRGDMTMFWMHEALYNPTDTFYHGYCLHMGKTAKGDGRPDLTAYIYDAEGYASGDITNNAGNAVSDTQLRLLEDFLASGYHRHGQLYGVYDKTVLKTIFVRQIIVWEIIEGGRNSFSVEPSYSESNSAYRKVITADTSLLNLYKEQLGLAQEFRNLRTDTGNSSSVFGSNKSYPMRWDSNINKYTTDYLSGLDGFGGCTSNNGTVDISYSSDAQKIRVTSKTGDPVPSNTTITCTKQIGDSSNTWAFYKFTNHSDWQDVINGQGNVKLTKSFKVYTDQNKVKIIKIDSNNNQLSEWQFTLKYKSIPSDSHTISSGSRASTLDVDITRSGEYILTEDLPPYGYERITETIVNINIQSKTITSSNPAQVQGRYNSTTNTFEIIVMDAKKTFEIKKLDENGQPLKGATFKVYKGNNFATQVKFTHSGNDFTYSENGNVTDVVDTNYSNYSLSLLPKGIYKIVETAVQPPYVLASRVEDRTFYIKVTDDYVVFDCLKDPACKNPKKTVDNAIRPKNYKTKVQIDKIGLGGKPLEGVKFALYASDKSQLINSNCAGGICEYATTASDLNNATLYITNSKGQIIIHNLPVGTYYLREVETIPPYVVPAGDDAYTKLIVDMTADGPLLNDKMSCQETISNATKEFNFYKVDENGNYLSGGKFKIQKYNDDTGKFEDIKISSVTNDGTTYQKEADVFKEDDKGKVQFTLAHGIATFVDMSVNTTYRVVELEAPKGYQVANIENSAIITIDKNGFAKGSGTIINQTRMLEGSTAQAELVIEIQTGQKVIRYGLIIGGTLIVIAGLMGVLIYISKKRK